MVGGADTVDRKCRSEEVELMKWLVGVYVEGLLLGWYDVWLDDVVVLMFSSGAVSYSREALLEFGKVHHELTFSLSDFDFLLRSDTADTSQQGPAAPASGRRRSGRTECPRRKRGKRGGLHARLKARAMRPPLPSLLLANVRSLENKLDELRARITTQREIRDCCALILTETWLSDSTPDSAIQLQTHSVHRGDRTAASGKNKGGGVCVFVNNRWCSDIKTVEKTLFKPT
ncbi:hypothetical protein NFI96_011011 [Prochilodus magdalenae]|nr:hypothetical protein NFI96_011011 [Prochilodus magdalenae]